MQILGLGAIMLILPVAVWGWRMLTHRTVRPRSAAARLLDPLHGDRGGLCQLLAARRRHGRCRPDSAAWSAMRCVRAPAVVFGPLGFIYRLVLGLDPVRRRCAATFLFASGWGARRETTKS